MKKTTIGQRLFPTLTLYLKSKIKVYEDIYPPPDRFMLVFKSLEHSLVGGVPKWT